MDKKEAQEWQEYAHGRITPVQFPFAPVNESLEWSDFYPEWIDEEKLFRSPECPPLPLPRVHQTTSELDLVIARVPCQESVGDQRNRQRNVHRL